MFPDINTKDIKPWAGLRPMTPNMLPIFKKSIEKRVWLNTGHGHLGGHLALILQIVLLIVLLLNKSICMS